MRRGAWAGVFDLFGNDNDHKRHLAGISWTRNRRLSTLAHGGPIPAGHCRGLAAGMAGGINGLPACGRKTRTSVHEVGRITRNGKRSDERACVHACRPASADHTRRETIIRKVNPDLRKVVRALRGSGGGFHCQAATRHRNELGDKQTGRQACRSVGQRAC